MKNRQLAHIWAQQTEEDLKAQDKTWPVRKEASNFFFERRVIYSYGTHFPAGRLLDGAVLISTQEYSPSTARHLSYVRQACSHLNAFNVPNVMAGTKEQHKENYQAYQREIKNRSKKLAKARVNLVWHLSYVNDLVGQANNYSKFFKLGYRMAPAFELEEIRTNYKEILAKEQARKEKKRKKDRAAGLVNLEAWRSFAYNGMAKPHPHEFRGIFGYHFLRLDLARKIIETTGGASVPIDHAIKVWPLIKAYCEKGREFKPNGKTIHIGHFAINHISTMGDITAGCHTFEFSEFQRMAVALGLEEE